MLNPNTGLLIRGLRTELKESVLPELTSGAAVRQLKAGLHLLARLERTWDLTPNYLMADNEDIESCLVQLFALNPLLSTLFSSQLKAHLQSPKEKNRKVTINEINIDGINDPNLCIDAQRNQVLHQCLEDIQNQMLDGNSADKCHIQSQKILNGLYRRMANRDSIFIGDIE